MKKLLFPFVIIAIVASSGFCRAPFTEFKVGYFYPKDVKSGWLFGANFGRMIDESLSWSFEANYFQKGVKETVKDYELNLPNNVTAKGRHLTLESTTRILSLFGKLNYEHPLAPQSPFYIRASAGLGWEMLWDKEDNYDAPEPVHSKHFFHGFGWQGSAGVGLAISSSANFFVDLFYNNSNVKRNTSSKTDWVKSWEEINISGIGIKFGVSIVGFGW